MHLASDFPHQTPNRGRCRVRIFEPEAGGDHHLVVLSELPDNTGQSVTNAIEQVAGEVLLANVLPSTETVVIEHYPAEAHPPEKETFDLVTFSTRDPEPVLRAGEWKIELGEPEWKRIDRQTVETLVGQPLRPRRT